MAQSWIWRSERITCVPPAGYEADPAVTAAIHSFDPGVIPIWRIAVYIPPGESVPRQFVHHGIGRRYPFFRHVRRPFQCDLPAVPGHEEPNFLDAIFEDVYSPSYNQGGPGTFMPWSWDTYYFCRFHYIRITVAAYLKRIEKRKAREAKMRKDWEEELEYRKRQIEPWVQKQLEKLSDSDWRKYAQHMQERERAIREGRRPPSHRSTPKKVTVDYGQAAARSPRAAPWETYRRVAPSRSNA